MKIFTGESVLIGMKKISVKCNQRHDNHLR